MVGKERKSYNTEGKKRVYRNLQKQKQFGLGCFIVFKQPNACQRLGTNLRIFCGGKSTTLTGKK